VVWPLVCIASGIAVSVASVSIDRAFDGALVPRWLTGGPDAALEILGTVAGSMVSLTALVLTVVLVVIQLGMGQFSPRIVAEILQDKPSQFAIGIFVGTFAHAMLALSPVSTAEDNEFVPGVAILVAFALVIISIMVLVLYANHIGRKLRAASLIEGVGTQIRAKLDELYPDQLGPAPANLGILPAPRPGVLVHIDADRLVEIATKADVSLEMLSAIGDFVPTGAPLVHVKGRPSEGIAAEILRRVTLDTERSLVQDLAYGPRLLVDICVRSLGEPFDPTTAVQAIDRIHDFLRRLSTRKFPTGEHRDARDGTRSGRSGSCSTGSRRRPGAPSPRGLRGASASDEQLVALREGEGRVLAVFEGYVTPLFLVGQGSGALEEWYGRESMPKDLVGTRVDHTDRYEHDDRKPDVGNPPMLVEEPCNECRGHPH